MHLANEDPECTPFVQFSLWILLSRFIMQQTFSSKWHAL